MRSNDEWRRWLRTHSMKYSWPDAIAACDELRCEAPVLPGGKEHVGGSADRDVAGEQVAAAPCVEAVGMGAEREVEPEEAAARRDVVAQLEQLFVQAPLRVRVHLDRRADRASAAGRANAASRVRSVRPSRETARSRPWSGDSRRYSSSAARRSCVSVAASLPQRRVHACECRGIVDQRRGRDGGRGRRAVRCSSFQKSRLMGE